MLHTLAVNGWRTRQRVGMASGGAASVGRVEADQSAPGVAFVDAPQLHRSRAAGVAQGHVAGRLIHVSGQRRLGLVCRELGQGKPDCRWPWGSRQPNPAATTMGTVSPSIINYALGCSLTWVQGHFAQTGLQLQLSLGVGTGHENHAVSGKPHIHFGLRRLLPGHVRGRGGYRRS